MVDTEIWTIGPVWYFAHLESPLPASEWLAPGNHKPVLKTTRNVSCQKCAPLTEWLVMFVDVPNQVS